MGCGNLVLAHDVRFNREVLAGTGLLWSKDEGSLLGQLQRVDADGDALRAEASIACRERITEFYTWDKAAADQERYLRFIAGEMVRTIPLAGEVRVCLRKLGFDLGATTTTLGGGGISFCKASISDVGDNDGRTTHLGFAGF